MLFPRSQNVVSKPRGEKYSKKIVGMDFDRGEKYYDRKGTYVYKKILLNIKVCPKEHSRNSNPTISK